MDELADRPEYCLDLSFMYSLLSLGYELGDERELRTGKKIDGVELGWSVQSRSGVVSLNLRLLGLSERR
jgi:guanosine-diphosphatase